MVSGEPIPVEKTRDAKVIGGTINGTGGFVMKTKRVGSDTLLAQIVTMVSEAQRTRAPIQRLADTVASYFVPAVLASAVITSSYGRSMARGHTAPMLSLARWPSSSSPALVRWASQHPWQ
jgi:cation transport ATPase